MKRSQLISIFSLAASMLPLSSTVTAQALYTQTGTDVTWQYIMDNKLIPVGVTSYKGITGSKIDVNQAHPLISSSPYANRKIDSRVAVHTMGNETVTRSDFPKWTRWYQEDGNTQVFRVFKGEINVRNDVYNKPRTEAELTNHSSVLKIINGAEWVEWSGTYTVVQPVEANIFQIWSNDDYVLMLDMDNNGKVQLNPRDQSGNKTMMENATGKSFDVRVRDYGNKYEVYLNGKFFYTRTYKAAYPDRAAHFRWGIYASMVAGTEAKKGVPKDAMMFVTGAQRRFSNDPAEPTVVTPKGPAGYVYATDEAKTITITRNVPQDIAYGQDGKYVYLKNQTANVLCSKVAFGSDPVVGGTKFCFTKATVTSVESKETNLLNVFPNPSENGIFNISQELNYEVHDMQGKVLTSGTGSRIDLSTYPKGTYLLFSEQLKLKLMR